MASTEEQAKQKIEEIGRDWEIFKKENDARLQKLEKNGGVADFEQKLAFINNSLDSASQCLKELDAEKQAREALEKRLDQIEVRSNRPGKTGSNNKEAEEYRAAFNGWMRKGRYEDESQLEKKAGSIGTDSEGGYTVPEQIDTEVIKLLGNESTMRSHARVITVSNQEYKQIVKVQGVDSGWVGEEEDRQETGSPAVTVFKPLFGEIYAQPAATQALLDDSAFNIEEWYSEEVAEEFAEQENAAFWLGATDKKPKGLLSYTTSLVTDKEGRPYGTIQHRMSSEAGLISADDVIDLALDLKRGYRNNAMYFANTSALRLLRKLKDDTGNYLWERSMQLGTPSTLNGYGIEIDDSIPEVVSGAISLVFADMYRSYRILDVRGIRTLRDPYTKKPFVKFYSTKRIGGGCPNTAAVKFLKVA